MGFVTILVGQHDGKIYVLATKSIIWKQVEIRHASYDDRHQRTIAQNWFSLSKKIQYLRSNTSYLCKKFQKDSRKNGHRNVKSLVDPFAFLMRCNLHDRTHSRSWGKMYPIEFEKIHENCLSEWTLSCEIYLRARLNFPYGINSIKPFLMMVHVSHYPVTAITINVI